MKKLPIGIQSFKQIIDNDLLYVDKTEHIYNLISGNLGSYFFLSRPRRFGKSLLVSTLKEIFLGNKELFKGLWIEKSDYKWQKHPVIFIDFSSMANATQEQLLVSILWKIDNIASEYNIDLSKVPSILEIKFEILINELSKINNVIILIDEYDKPMLDYIENIPQAEIRRDVLKSFYTVIKSSSNKIKFIFLTGITKFSRTSIFSGINNIKDLTLSTSMATITGYTQDEVDKYFYPYYEKIAVSQNLKVDSLKNKIKGWYNGYRFSSLAITLYNPYSLLLYLSSGELFNYWFETGTPTFLVKLIKTKNYKIENIENIELNALDLQNLELDDLQIIPLLFQTGYLTIKSYNPDSCNYLLAYPNEETKISFLHYFMKFFASITVASLSSSVWKLTQAIRHNNLEEFFETLKIFFALIPYTIQISQEKYYQSIFYVILNLIGVYVTAEITTNIGRIDSVIIIDKFIYIFEFKIDDSAQNALNQIYENKYYQKYLNSNKEIILIGAEFDAKERNIKNWIYEKFK